MLILILCLHSHLVSNYRLTSSVIDTVMKEMVLGFVENVLIDLYGDFYGYSDYVLYREVFSLPNVVCCTWSRSQLLSCYVFQQSDNFSGTNHRSQFTATAPDDLGIASMCFSPTHTAYTADTHIQSTCTQTHKHTPLGILHLRSSHTPRHTQIQ